MTHYFRGLRSQLAITLVAIGMTLPLISHANAQGILDRIGNQVQQQLRQEVQRVIPQFVPQQQPGLPQQPAIQSNSIPSEGGNQNIRAPFNPSAFLGPQPSAPPRIINPSPTRQPYIPPQNSQPNFGQPQYVQPNYSQPQYIQPYNQSPQFGSTQSAMPSNTGNTYSVPGTRSETTSFSGKLIKVRCPKQSAQAVNYKLVLSGREYPYTMRPGESQSFAEKQSWLIRFMSGSNEVTYQLRGGNEYSFELDDSGRLQLYKDEPQSTKYAEPPTR